MTKISSILALLVAAVIFSISAAAQEATQLEVLPLNTILPGLANGQLDFDPSTGLWHGTNGVFVRYGATVLTADSVSVDSKSGEVDANGHVRIESGSEVWVGEHITYNFKTKLMHTDEFRTGKVPTFAGATGLVGNTTNRTYTANRAFVTTDDIENPAYRVRASKITIVPGKYVRMWNAVLLAGNVPVFYFPYYQRNLGPRSSNFNFTPGYRTSYGAYLLGTYEWFIGDAADVKFHADYRTRRGPGVGPDVFLHLGQWGEAAVKYYYLYDLQPDYNANSFPWFNPIPHNRQRFNLGWQATPATNLNLKALINYQTDPLVLRDFFPGDYDGNPQPNTFIEAQKYWDNWSLDALATPRVNSFFNQIERLPDLKLTGYRQQILDTPLYYDSESSLAWNRAYTANTTNGFYWATNGFYTDAALRADTYHQITLPWTFFNWLNVAPRAGGRFTYYNRHAYAPDDDTSAINRAVFNTGIGASFKATALWADAKNSFFDVNGLRHILEPSLNYTFVTRPSTGPLGVPQLDGEMPALLISPVTFPDYNSLDSIDSMNVMRLGLRNVLQTKRDGELDNLVNWNLMLDCRLDRQHGQSALNDLYSQFALRPRSWLTLEEQLRYDTEHGRLNLSFHQITFAPGDRWSWGIGHLYIRPGNWGVTTLNGNNFVWDENNFLSSTIFYRINDNWGLRAQHDLNLKTGHLQRQNYSIYRDLRSWTAALTFRVQDEPARAADFTVAFQLSLKAMPAHGVGDDVVNPYRLVGE